VVVRDNPRERKVHIVVRRATNPVRIGSFNQTVVLDAIRRSSGLSRVELAGSTGLYAQAVTNICRRLIAAGLVREAGTGTVVQPDDEAAIAGTLEAAFDRWRTQGRLPGSVPGAVLQSISREHGARQLAELVRASVAARPHAP